MTTDREALERDVLFLGLTRPALFAGVPLEAAVPIMMAGAITMIVAGNPLYAIAVAGGAYFAARMVVRHDPNTFRLLFLWTQTKARSRNRVFWGGCSYSPLPLKGLRRKGFGRHD